MTYPGQPAQGADPYAHVDDFFGNAGKSLHFDAEKGYQVGTWKGGEIVEIKPKQHQTDAKTKKPQFWDDDPNRPKYTLPVILQTDERDPSDPHDDGKRTAFIDGLKEKALREHLREINAKLRPRGVLFLAWVSGAGKIGDAKQYQAHYTPAPPEAHAQADAMFGAPQQPQQQYAPPAPQQPYGAPPAAPQGYPPAAPPAAPVAPQAAPQQPDLWQQPAPVAQPQWPAQPPAAPPAAPPAPVAPPVAPPAPPQPAAPAGPPAFDLDVAYAHLTAEQRAALRAANMSPEQIAAVYGAPRAA